MKRQSKNIIIKVGWILFYSYIILLSYFLFFSEHYGRENVMKDYRYNLEFFREIKRFIIYREKLGFETFLVNIVGNVVAFAPFGFLLPSLDKKFRSFIFVVFLSMLFSLCVETIQLVLKVGIFDVDDIILNTAGGIVGYLCYAIVSRAAGGFRSRKTR